MFSFVSILCTFDSMTEIDLLLTCQFIITLGNITELCCHLLKCLLKKFLVLWQKAKWKPDGNQMVSTLMKMKIVVQKRFHLIVQCGPSAKNDEGLFLKKRIKLLCNVFKRKLPSFWKHYIIMVPSYGDPLRIIIC